MNIRLSLLEILLLELVLWFALWLGSDYLASLLTLIIGAIVSAVLIIALISEWLEPTRVSRRYFHIMAISIAAPIIAAILYIYILGGHFEFLKGGY